jgi:hypothetical protein
MRSETCKCGENKERLAASYCNKCQREYTRADYAKNKEKYVAKAKRNNERYKKETYEWLVVYFAEHPCVDCGETDPVVLDFDHRDGINKEMDVSGLMRDKRYEAAKAEVEKCDVRCSNCHRRRTARQQGWYWLQILNMCS